MVKTVFKKNTLRVIVIIALSALAMEGVHKLVWHCNPDREKVESSIRSSSDLNKKIGVIRETKVFRSLVYFAGEEKPGYKEYRLRVDGDLGMATVIATKMDHEEEFSLRIIRH